MALLRRVVRTEREEPLKLQELRDLGQARFSPECRLLV